MQTKKDNETLAQGVTQKEFCERMNDIRLSGERALDNIPPARWKRRCRKMLFLFDNAAFHKCPQLLQDIADIKPDQRVPHPAWAPDFNQPIEHSHGRFKAEMKRQMDLGWWPNNMEECWEKCQQVWEQVNTEEMVAKDVARLPHLYEYVMNVSNGNWPPPQYS